jgi:hypothetical protein
LSTVDGKEGIIHNPERTAIAAKALIVRKRRCKQITAIEARRAFTAIESDVDDLDSQLRTLLSHPAVFGRDACNIVKGVSIDEKLFRDALRDFVDETRARNRCLSGEPQLVYSDLEFRIAGAALVMPQSRRCTLGLEC